MVAGAAPPLCEPSLGVPKKRPQIAPLLRPREFHEPQVHGPPVLRVLRADLHDLLAGLVDLDLAQAEFLELVPSGGLAGFAADLLAGGVEDGAPLFPDAAGP